MNKSFWLSFLINEAISISTTFVASSGLNAELKTALEGFIKAGQGVLISLHLA
jgi:hypothetical protein